jgi:hypothetical protein
MDVEMEFTVRCKREDEKNGFLDMKFDKVMDPKLEAFAWGDKDRMIVPQMDDFAIGEEVVAKLTVQATVDKKGYILGTMKGHIAERRETLDDYSIKVTWDKLSEDGTSFMKKFAGKTVTIEKTDMGDYHVSQMLTVKFTSDGTIWEPPEPEATEEDD